MVLGVCGSHCAPLQERRGGRERSLVQRSASDAAREYFTRQGVFERGTSARWLCLSGWGRVYRILFDILGRFKLYLLCSPSHICLQKMASLILTKAEEIMSGRRFTKTVILPKLYDCDKCECCIVPAAHTAHFLAEIVTWEYATSAL